MCDKNISCLKSILEKIILLQQNKEKNQNGCSKPFLTDTATANTRPINLYCCCTNALWTMPYEYNELEGTSSIFRIESLNNNTATFRILTEDETITDNFFTIDLSYISCIKCLDDILLTDIDTN